MSSIINFVALGLPSESKTAKVKVPVPSNTPLEDGKVVTSKDGKRKLRIVSAVYDCLYLAKVYGSKKKELKRDETAISKIESFLRAVFETRSDFVPDTDDDDSENDTENASADAESVSFEEWRDRLAARSANAILAQRACGVARKAEKQNPANIAAVIEAQSENDSLDDAAIAKLQAALDAAKAKNAAKKPGDSASKNV